MVEIAAGSLAIQAAKAAYDVWRQNRSDAALDLTDDAKAVNSARRPRKVAWPFGRNWTRGPVGQSRTKRWTGLSIKRDAFHGEWTVLPRSPITDNLFWRESLVRSLG